MTENFIHIKEGPDFYKINLTPNDNNRFEVYSSTELEELNNTSPFTQGPQAIINMLRRIEKTDTDIIDPKSYPDIIDPKSYPDINSIIKMLEIVQNERNSTPDSARGKKSRKIKSKRRPKKKRSQKKRKMSKKRGKK